MIHGKIEDFTNLNNELCDYFLVCRPDKIPVTVELDSFMSKNMDSSYQYFNVFGAYKKILTKSENKLNRIELFNELINQCLINLDEILFYSSDKYLPIFMNRMDRHPQCFYNNIRGIVYSPKYGIPFDYSVVCIGEFIEIQLDLYVAKKK